MASRPDAAWTRVATKIGRRYAGCRFENFRLFGDKEEQALQFAVLEQVRDYAGKIAEYVTACRNVVLYGPPGTGKDHLLSALMREACLAGLSVEWVNGMTLFEQRRDAIDTDVKERDLLKQYLAADVLAISDPVPPWGDLQQGQAEFLFRLIDGRYRRMRPTWVTANFQNGKDAAGRVGSQVIDRLCHDGLRLDCNWPSYRKAMS